MAMNVYSQEWIQDRYWRRPGATENTFCGILETAANVRKNKIVEYELHILDETEKEFFRTVPLQPSEKLFRIKTDKTRIANIIPLVKINFEKGLIYFIQQREDEQVHFERGLKLSYLNVSDDAVMDVYLPY